jgi:hypothetical protein
MAYSPIQISLKDFQSHCLHLFFSGLSSFIFYGKHRFEKLSNELRTLPVIIANIIVLQRTLLQLQTIDLRRFTDEYARKLSNEML